MIHRDFIYLNVPASLANARRVIPLDFASVERELALALTHASTEISFLKRAGLMRVDSASYTVPIAEAVVHLSDLTEEGQDFLMSQAMVKWLAACDRKSNKMLQQGASEEERLAVYADPKGLYQRLENFRKQRKAKAS
jgi:hypothetical protein